MHNDIAAKPDQY